MKKLLLLAFLLGSQLSYTSQAEIITEEMNRNIKHMAIGVASIITGVSCIYNGVSICDTTKKFGMVAFGCGLVAIGSSLVCSSSNSYERLSRTRSLLGRELIQGVVRPVELPNNRYRIVPEDNNNNV